MSNRRVGPTTQQGPPMPSAATKQEKTVIQSTPFAHAAQAYVDAGWAVFPLPYRAKKSPPPGVTGWSGVDATPEVLGHWLKLREPKNIGVRAPETVLGIDADTYKDEGRETLDEAVERLGPLPATFRSSAREDGSGIRWFRVPAGRKWKGELGPKVEIVQWGHRYAVVWPSVHPDLGTPYGWTDDLGLPMEGVPNVDELADLPDAWVAELADGSADDVDRKAVGTDVRDWLNGLPGGDPCQAVGRALEEALAALEKGSRHVAMTRGQMDLARKGEQGHAGSRDALKKLKDAFEAAIERDPRPGGDDPQEWSRGITGAVAVIAAQPTPEGDRGCCAPVDEDGKKVPLAVRLRKHVEEHFDAFPAGGDGRIFVQGKEGGRAELLTANFVIRAAGHLGNSSGNLGAPAREAATILTARAVSAPARDLALRVHYRPGRIVLDLAQPNSTRCVVVTPSGWTVEDVPPRDVVFQPSGLPLPDPVPGGQADELCELLRWKLDDPRWLLVKGWLPASLLANKPRPVMCLFGPMGSSKSTTGRFLTGVLDPKPDGVLGGGFGKNRSDDETKVLKSYVPGWDNVSTLSDEGADFLSRMVTGDLIEKRQLYTDADLVSISYRRTAVITGVNMPRGVKPDTLDRLVLLPLPRFDGDRLPEGKLDAEWERAQPRVLAGVLDLAVQMLAGMPTALNPAGLRMADYAEALWAIDPELYDAYRDNVSTARGDMAADDPFIEALVAWLRSCPEQEWEGTPSEAVPAGMGHADGWWPTNGRSLSEQITKCIELLRAVGITVTTRKSNGRRLMRLVLVPVEEA